MPFVFVMAVFRPFRMEARNVSFASGACLDLLTVAMPGRILRFPPPNYFA
jgi:hypothetical protein